MNHFGSSLLAQAHRPVCAVEGGPPYLAVLPQAVGAWPLPASAGRGAPPTCPDGAISWHSGGGRAGPTIPTTRGSRSWWHGDRLWRGGLQGVLPGCWLPLRWPSASTWLGIRHYHASAHRCALGRGPSRGRPWCVVPSPGPPGMPGVWIECVHPPWRAPNVSPTGTGCCRPRWCSAPGWPLTGPAFHCWNPGRAHANPPACSRSSPISVVQSSDKSFGRGGALQWPLQLAGVAPLAAMRAQRSSERWPETC